MNRIEILGGYFTENPHAYYDDQGKRVPSLTQCLSLQGLSDFGGASPEVLANAARRGTEVHNLAAAYNKFGDYDPTWVTDEIEPYFMAYLQFMRDTGFVPDAKWTEVPMIASIAGMRIGVKPDVFGKFGKYDAIVEIKAASVVQPSWSVQTALQELAIYNSSRVGRAQRFALQLFKNGKYKLHSHWQHAQDEAAGIAALRLTWWRLEQKQNVWVEVGG